MEFLNYQPGDRFNAVQPLDTGISSITAEKYLKVYDQALTLEGLCFDRDGNMYFTSTVGNSIFRVDMKTKELSVVFHQKDVRPAAVKIHKDGRIFACCLTNESIGGVLAMNPDGTDVRCILRGYSVDDMVFDAQGGFYFTDFTGDFRNPSGGVYYVTPDFQRVISFCKNMCQPNGIALSTNGDILWVTETQANRLHRFVLSTGRANICYYFSGTVGPDSCSVDADDNLYVAIPGQGRVMVFNAFGFPIGQVMTPGRNGGHHLYTTHPMVRPGTRELYITCKDDAPDSEGSWILCAGAYAKGNGKAYQFQ